ETSSREGARRTSRTEKREIASVEKSRPEADRSATKNTTTKENCEVSSKTRKSNRIPSEHASKSPETSTQSSIPSGTNQVDCEPESKAPNTSYPQIQVRPLTELLKQEILAVTQEVQQGVAAPTTLPPNAAARTASAQNRPRTVSSHGNEASISDRLATMDKEGLKYIINNSDTIYNEHLKLQARKRLREEIRRQLKEIELEQPKDKPEGTVLIEDEIVDAIKLPQILLQEIEKCFGIELSVGEQPECPASVQVIAETAETQQRSTEKESCGNKQSSADAMTRIKDAEQFKAVTGKEQRQGDSATPQKAATKTEQIKKQEINRETMESPIACIVLSSSEDEEEEEDEPAEQLERVEQLEERNLKLELLEDDADDEEQQQQQQQLKQKEQPELKQEIDAASDHSDCSDSSAKRRYQQRLKADADNVIDSFEKLILPHLKATLVERYRSTHCSSRQSQLHFISCVVTSSEHNTQTFSKIEVAKMQQNLKASDNRQAIEFLLRQTVNVVNLLKQTALARRKQQQQQQQANEISGASSFSASCSPCKSAELASELPHQREADAAAAVPAEQAALASASASSQPAAPPPTTLRSGALNALPLGMPYLGLDAATLPRLSPGNLALPGYLEPSESTLTMGDSVMHNLLEIDRRLLENQNRRGFLEEMIMKFQKEKSDLEMHSLELQNRKFLLLNAVIGRNQVSAAATPTNSPAPSTVVQATPAAAEGKRRLRKRCAVYVKRVRLLPKRKPRAGRATAAQRQRSQSTESNPVRIPQPIKHEPPEINEAPKAKDDALGKRCTPQHTSESSEAAARKRQRLSRSTAAAAQQPLAVIPPLPPPPPPPEPFAHMSSVASSSSSSSPPYELPRMLRKPTPPPPAAAAPLPLPAENCNYGYIPSGRLHHITSPITQIRTHKVSIIAASENGDIYVFNIGTHKLEQQIPKHSEAITNMFLCERESFLYTTSLDGFLKKSSLEVSSSQSLFYSNYLSILLSSQNLERVTQTVYLKEPLQSIDIAWGIAFIGSRWGRIFTYNIAANQVVDMPLLSTGQSIIAVKATKEGARKIVMLGCKGNTVFLHDAASGLLLRRLSVPEGLNVYSLLLADGHVFCGTQKNEVFKFEFASGAMVNTLSCGNGAVAMATYRDRYLLIGCYDGFIYVLNREKGNQLGRFNGPGRLVLALAIAGDKVITSSKDNSLEVLEIPPEILSLD
ncbi:hypothetical protein KR222_007601, partial [Zaprionus bogoriensis]